MCNVSYNLVVVIYLSKMNNKCIKTFHIFLRLVEQAIHRQGWGGLEDVLRHLPGTYFEKLEARSAKGGKMTNASSSASKVALVYFIGGVTYSEISALRFLAKQKGYKILIATTAIINGHRMLNSFAETVR